MKRSLKFGALAMLLASGCMDVDPEQTAEPAVEPSTVVARRQAIESVTASEESGWQRTGNLAAARLLHTATRLQDGRVLVVGGYNSSTELYDPATGTWSPTGSAPANYRGATATLLPSGKVLVTGGNDRGITAALYDPTSGAWSATGLLTTVRYHHTATLLPDGRVLVIGGTTGEYGGTTLASAELYDPATGTWATVGALTQARHRHTATPLSDGRVLVAGGQDASGRMSSAELFDPATGAAVTVGALGTARASHTASLLKNGQILVAGGAVDGEPATSAELFDPATGTWSATRPMSKPRRLHTATVLANGKVLVTGGYDGSTGIQAAAELYDPTRGVWDVMPSMELTRYQHTATLLSNGRVLVSGGFSTGDQASAEVFSAAQIQVVLEEGTGWQLLNVSGANTDGDVPPYDSTLYMANDDLGITHVPLPDGIREDLAADSANRTTVFFLDKKALDELRLSQEQGAPTPYLQSILEPMEPSMTGSGDGCPDHRQKVTNTFSLNVPLNYTKNLSAGFSGTFSTSGSLVAQADVGVQVIKKRKRFLWFGCVPYGLDLDYLELGATGTLNYGASLSGTVSYGNSWAFDIVKPPLAIIPIPVGKVVIPINVNLPITAGVDLQASVTGGISYTASQSTSVDYTARCTLDGCTSAMTVNAPSPSGSDVTGNIQGRIQPSIWIEAAVRAAVVHDRTNYVQVGLRPYADGDLWGHLGYGCGDADGDGAEEFVKGGYFDLNWRLNVTGQAYLVPFSPRKWPQLYSTGRQKIYFKNLVPAVSGGWTPFDPMMIGPASTEQYANTGYTVRMRPCFPFPTDNERAVPESNLRDNHVTYRVDWGDGTGEEFSGHRFDAALPRRHAWLTSGVMPVKVTALYDSHGRSYNSTYTRGITVDPKPPPTIPPEYFREVRLAGELDVMDHDPPFGSDKHTTRAINEVAYLSPSSPTKSFFYSECADNEVRAEVTVALFLQADNVTVLTQVSAKMYEEEACANNDLETSGQSSVTVARDGSGQLNLQLINPELTTDDKITLSFSVLNNQAP
jgi:WD40 repeat protein